MHKFYIRPVGQAVKTLASHAGNRGSIPLRVTINYLSKTQRTFVEFCESSFIYNAGANDVEVTPVPIPNTEVKLNSAENT